MPKLLRLIYIIEYRTWGSMRQRCYNPNHPKYEYYGGRGIIVCDRWNRFENFLEDMGERPDGMTLDRIDNNGNYEPTNCHWTTYSMQNYNRRAYKKEKTHCKNGHEYTEENTYYYTNNNTGYSFYNM